MIIDTANMNDTQISDFGMLLIKFMKSKLKKGICLDGLPYEVNVKIHPLLDTSCIAVVGDFDVIAIISDTLIFVNSTVFDNLTTSQEQQVYNIFDTVSYYQHMTIIKCH